MNTLTKQDKDFLKSKRKKWLRVLNSDKITKTQARHFKQLSEITKDIIPNWSEAIR